MEGEGVCAACVYPPLQPGSCGPSPPPFPWTCFASVLCQRWQFCLFRPFVRGLTLEFRVPRPAPICGVQCAFGTCTCRFCRAPGIVLRNVGTITLELSPCLTAEPQHLSIMFGGLFFLLFLGPGWILGFMDTWVCAILICQEFGGRVNFLTRYIVALSSTSWTQPPQFEYELVWNMPFLSIC